MIHFNKVLFPSGTKAATWHITCTYLLHQMRKMKIVTVFAFIILQFIPGDRLLAGQKEAFKSTPGVRVQKKENIHYTGKYCKECHVKTPEKGGAKFLKYDGDFEKLCGRCHDSASNYVHPAGMKPTEGKIGKIPASFPLKNGRVSCSTCHDLYLQCRESPNPKKKTSLRGAPFKKRTDFCFNCHNKKSYEMQKVHDQLNANGDMVDEKFLYCHVEKPDVEQTKYKNIKLLENSAAICQGCHVISGTHVGGGFNHLVKPSAKALADIKHMENEFNLIMPLDDNGKMTCITCHNPHAKGVIPAELPAAKGADSKSRQRLPGLCVECHHF